MAIIDYLDGVAPIQGSRRGVTFDVSQAGPIAKRKAMPINPQTNLRNQYRLIIKNANDFFWALNAGQKNLWKTFGIASGITGPWGMGGNQLACASFFHCAVNAYFAGDGYPVVPGPPVPVVGVTFSALVRIDNTTIRATFLPNPAGANNRIYLRQALPGPGVRRWGPADGYISEYSAKNPNSTFDFTPRFDHLAGWHGRYWAGTQNAFGGRSTELLFEL